VTLATFRQLYDEALIPDDERPVELDDERLPEATIHAYTATHHRPASSCLCPADEATGIGDSGLHG
jgi:hypothetical protein